MPNMRQLSSSEIFLLEGIRANSRSEFEDLINDLLRKGYKFDWHSLLGGRCKMLMPIFLELKSAKTELRIPQEIENSIRREWAFNIFDNERIKAASKELIELFNRENIQIIFFKGAALIFTVYKADIEVRPMRDIDVLLKKGDVKRAANLLRENGYVQNFDHKAIFHVVYTKGGVKVELHWDIVQKSSSSLLNELFATSQKIAVDGSGAQVLGPEASILISCINFDRDVVRYNWYSEADAHYNILFFFYEIKRMLEYYGTGFSWDAFISLTRSSSYSYGAFTLIFLARKIANVDVPEAVLAEMRRHYFTAKFMRLSGKTGYREISRLFFVRTLIYRMINFYRPMDLYLMAAMLLYRSSQGFYLRLKAFRDLAVGRIKDS